MHKDIDPELYLQPEEQNDDIVFEPLPEIDPVPPLSDRLKTWIESVDR
ncbi:hypothetical protein [Spirochaeta isovalerica]|uniref:Uncharacterized protein n=1 Tax=Spirochaeta isovalerica TaxID=150 RepID=A0A841R8M6_9SPIO|nr:hypothetical protein [Spirochaeta isovalerica]MBB6480255.1 hypothetical protein [Spirochaeta isovalerica]